MTITMVCTTSDMHCVPQHAAINNGQQHVSDLAYYFISGCSYAHITKGKLGIMFSYNFVQDGIVH